MKSFLQMIGLMSDEAEEFYKKGREKCGQAQHELAIKEYSDAIRLNNNKPEYYEQRAWGHYMLKCYNEAIKDYSEAIRLKSNEPKYYRKRASLLETLELNEEAIQDYNEAIRLAQNKPDYKDESFNIQNDYHARTRLKFKFKRYNQIIEDCSEVIRLYEYDAIIYYDRGVAHLNLKHYENAIEDIDDVFRCLDRYGDGEVCDNRFPMHYHCRGYAQLQLKNYKKAIEDFHAAIRIQKKYPTLWEENVDHYWGCGLAQPGWRLARKAAGLEAVRVHDLKHTYGRRLRAAGVSFEDRQDLLGHRSGRITTYYSSAELQNLYEATNKVCEQRRSGVTLTLLCNPNRQQGVLRRKPEVVTASTISSYLA